MATPAHRRRLSPAASPATASSSSFRELRLPEIVAHAGIHNTRSHRAISRLGMSYGDADDFDHPRLDEADPLRRQVLYRMKRNGWLARL
jgi:RimJ/RimL family protein N-acetyltransferase